MDYNNLEYYKIHNWLAKNYGRASICENPDCKCKSIKRYEWAKLKGKDYEKNRDNFIMLCCSCHRKYDYTQGAKDKISKIHKGKTMSKESREKISKSLKGNERGGRMVIDNITGKRYRTIKEAAIDLNIRYTNLRQYLCGTRTNKTNLVYEKPL